MAYDLSKVISESIQVTNWTVEMFPQFQQAQNLAHISSLIPQYEHCYSMNNSVIAFVSDSKFLVTPFTMEKMDVLQHEGFRKEYFEVPFSNRSYPQAEGGRWRALLAQAKTAY